MDDYEIFIEEAANFSTQLARKIRQLVSQLDDNFQTLTDEDIKEIIDSSNTHLYLAKLKKSRQIVGMITLVTYRIPYRKKAWVEDVVIDAPYRSRGFGIKMLKFVMDKAKEMHITSLNLTSNPFRNAGKFYEQLGFEQRNTLVYRILLDYT